MKLFIFIPLGFSLSLFVYSPMRSKDQQPGTDTKQQIVEFSKNVFEEVQREKKIDELKQQIKEIEDRINNCKNAVKIFKYARNYISYDIISTEIKNCEKYFQEKQNLEAELKKYKEELKTK
jgi:peroxiredoxin family protein